MTETSPLLTVLQYEDHFGDAVTSAGKPVLGAEVRVVDELDRDVPVGQSGEIISRGANTMKGYWKRPEITAEVLRGGWMHTGDIGRFDAERISLHPGSQERHDQARRRECLHARGRVDDRRASVGAGSGRDRSAGSQMGRSHPSGGRNPQRSGVNRGRTDRLVPRADATHFKCPASVVFVDSLPKGGTGKVQKGVLREKYGH